MFEPKITTGKLNDLPQRQVCERYSMDELERLVSDKLIFESHAGYNEWTNGYVAALHWVLDKIQVGKPA